jgi:hypothetical protein
LWEAWLGVLTNNAPEAVVNKTQRIGLPQYQALMASQLPRVLPRAQARALDDGRIPQLAKCGLECHS